MFPSTNQNPFSPEFQEALRVKTLVDQATAQNAKNTADYMRVSNDWIANAVRARDMGLPIPPLADPPKVVHIDAKGVQTEGPDFVAQKPSLPAATGVPSSTTIASQNPPADRLDYVMQGLGSMFAMMTQMAADLKAIRVKVQA